ncbi:hypothetical protein [Agromyces seonyuensis]|uniref:Uncharacterized protein n=1 Tax=Agromyces seonyuensis TaxID=2662446 RepID=A0A6I4P090_9MICO|nr:hypothetical protein [Agromyces seonyuensis]MWC00044.1 hypothetical protein [Agromyces seonyuensis]
MSDARTAAAVETVAIGDGMWRVSREGVALGVVHVFVARDGERFMARVVDRQRRCWVRVGEYWEFERAVAALVS